MKLSSTSQSKNRQTPDSIKESLAKTSTLYSDHSVELRAEIHRPIEAIACYYLSLYYDYWQTDVLVRSIAHRAYANCYQGKWQQVQEILELKITGPEELERWYLEHNPYEFYGNILPEALKIEKRTRYKDTSSPNLKPVHHSQRVRGYKDKGSRRLPHEDHGQPPYSDERIDRRSQVFHPLLRADEVKELTQIEEMPHNASLPEGGENNVYTKHDCQVNHRRESQQTSEQEKPSGESFEIQRTLNLRDTKSQEVHCKGQKIV